MPDLTKARNAFKQPQQGAAVASTDLRQKFQDKVVQTRAPEQQTTAYQRNMQDPIQLPQQKDTFRSTLGKLTTRSKTDREGANAGLQLIIGQRDNRASMFYDPYAVPTNQAVKQMADLFGQDIGEINDTWFESNAWMKDYFKPSTTTNNPTSPGKKGSKEEWAGYYYNQLWQAEENTKKAELELSALQEEFNYWANQTDRNYSDQEILSRIDWSKYKTLQKMDEARAAGAPMELNRAVSWLGEDTMYGMLWAARNGGGTGNIYMDMANSYNGVGNTWKENQEIAAKLDIGNAETYAPYSVGSTMDAERSYFGVPSFNQEWIDDNRAKYLGSGDATAAKFYANVVKAEEYTQKLEEQKGKMDTHISTLLRYYDDPDLILRALKDSSDYKDLFALDDTLKTGSLKDTTRAVDYRWRDVEAYVRAECGKKKPSVVDVVSEATTTRVPTPAPVTLPGPVTTPAPVTLPGPVTTPMPDPLGVLPKDQSTLPEPGTVPGTYGYKETTPAPTSTPAPDAVVSGGGGMPDPFGVLPKDQSTLPPPGTVSGTYGYKEPVLTDAEMALEGQAVANMDTVAPTILEVGTDAEKTVLETGKTSLFDWGVEKIRNSVRDAGEWLRSTAKESVLNGYVGTAGTVYDYEKHQRNKDDLQKRLDGFLEEWQGLNDRASKAEAVGNMTAEEFDMMQWLMSSEAENSDDEWSLIKKQLSVDPTNPDALAGLYLRVAGDPLQAGSPDMYAAKRNQAQLWWEAMSNGLSGVSFLTDEEQARLDDLTRQKDAIEGRIQKEDEYLQQKEKAYQDAKAEQERLIEVYAAAAELNRFLGKEEDNDNLLQVLDYAYALGSEPVPERYLPNNPIDTKVAKGDLTREAATQQATVDAVQNASLALELDGLLKQLEENGAELPEGMRENIKAHADQLREEAQAYGYVMLDGTAGFAEKAESGKSKAAKGDFGRTAQIIATGDFRFLDGWGDLTDKGIHILPMGEADALRGKLLVMTDEEKNRFYYLLETGGGEAASQYLDLLNKDGGVLQVRSSQELQRSAEEFASENALTGAIATILSFATNMYGGAKAVGYMLDRKLFGGEMNPYDPSYDDMLATQSLRGGVKSRITSAFGGEDKPGSKIANMLYDGFTSAVDSWLNAQMMQGATEVASTFFSGTKLAAFFSKIGAAKELTEAGYNAAEWAGDAGVASQIGSWLGSGSFTSKVGNFVIKASGDLAHASTMGLNAAASAYRDAYLKTGSEEKAMKMAVATFFAETGSEAITVGNLHEAFSSGAGMEGAKNLLVEFFKNGAEEFLGEGANEWVSQHAEQVIMGADSEYQKTLDKYLAMNIPEEAAKAMADQEMWKNILTAAATGFISSGFGTAAEYARGRMSGTEGGMPAASTEPAVTTEQAVTEEAPAATEQTVTEEAPTVTPKAAAAAELLSKDIAALNSASEGTATSAAVSIAAVLNTGDTNADKAAAQTFTSSFAGGDAKLATNVLQKILMLSPVDTAPVKQAITRAVLAGRESQQTLRGLFDKVKNGGTMTSADVSLLLNDVQADMNADPQGFEKKYQSALKESRVANKTAEILQTGESAAVIESAEQSVQQAQENVQTAQTVLEQAEADVTTANQNVQSAVANQQAHPDDPSMIAPVQQAANELEGAMTNQQTQQQAVEAAQANLEEAQKKKTETTTKEMNKVRAQAQAEVNQQMQQEAEAQAQQEFQDALAAHTPTKAFSHAVTVEDASLHGEVQLTGVYAVNDGGHIIYTTPEGYVMDTYQGAWENADLPELDSVMNNWTANTNPNVHPVAWMNHSLNAVNNDTGEVVTLIGFAGQQDGFDPVVVDSNGNVYTSDQITMQPDPFTGDNGNAALFDAFEDAGGENLPEYGSSESQVEQNPEVLMPEGFVAYPDGPVHMTDQNGAEHEIAGYTYDQQDFFSLVDTEGNKLPASGFDFGGTVQGSDTPEALLKWMVNDQTTKVKQAAQTQQTTPEQQITEPVEAQYSEGKVNPKTNAPLKNWQNPKFHGEVKDTHKKINPKSKAFKNFFKHNAQEAMPYVTNPDGTPRIFYRGYGNFGAYQYVEHKSPAGTLPNGKEYYKNFYMDKLSTAQTYAGTSKITHFRDVKNWETAKAAMQDLGYDLEEITRPDGTGYYVVTKNGVPATSNKWAYKFEENELANFRATYGGGLEVKGIHAGFIATEKPVIIHGNGANWTAVHGSVTAPDGTQITETMSTDSWAMWAFQHGADAVILEDIKDNKNGGGDIGIEVITSQPGMFKSVYNGGDWNYNAPNIMSLKNGKQQKQLTTALEQMLGRPLSEQFRKVVEQAKNGELPPMEKILALPEIQEADALKPEGSSIDPEIVEQAKKESGDTFENVVKALPEEVASRMRSIKDMLTAQGSAVYENGKKKGYTGKVKQGKRLDLLIGLAAAGKSSIADPISAANGSRLIDSDQAKEAHPDYGGGFGAGYTHVESKLVINKLAAESAARGDNAILPIVGDDLDSVLNRMAPFLEAGYEIHVHMADLPQAKAIGRALSRFANDGRYIEMKHLYAMDPVKIAEVFEALKGDERISGYARWSTDVPFGTKPIPLDYSDAGEIAVVGSPVGSGSSVYRLSAGNKNGRNGAQAGSNNGSGSNRLTPTQQQAQKTGEKIKSHQRIAQDLISKLGIGNYIGSNRFGSVYFARGFYDPHGKYVATKAKEAGNIRVTAHEIGHAIADKLQLRGTQQMAANLFNSNPGFWSDYAPNDLLDEAMAEFFLDYLNDEQAARAFAGDAFYDSFEQKLRQDKTWWDAVQEAKQQLTAFNAASTDAKIQSTIRYDRGGTRKSLKENIRSALAQFVDSTAAAEEIEHFAREMLGGKDVDLRFSVRKNALLAGHSSKRVTKILVDTLVNPEGEAIGDGFGKRLQDAGFEYTAENLQALERYMLARHSMYRMKENKPVFGEWQTEQEIQAYIDEVERTNPQLKDAAEAWQGFRNDFLQTWMVDTGYWTQEFLDELNRKYPDYVPTFRVKDNSGVSQGFTKSGAKRYTMHEATGSSQDIYSPFASFVGMIDTMVNQVEHNRVAQVFDRLYQQFDGMGAFGREILGETGDSSYTPDTSTLNSKQEQLMDLLNGSISDDTLRKVLDVVKSRPGINQDEDANILTVHREDGTTAQYEIYDPELFNLLAGVNKTLGKDALSKAVSTIGAVTRTMSMLTTGSNPLFAARNAVRDFQTSVNYGSWASSYLTGIPKWIKAFAEVARGKSADYQAYEALGGGGWTRVNQNNQKGINSLASEMFGEDTSTLGRKGKFALKKAWNLITLDTLNGYIEQASRFAEYKYGNHDLTTSAGRQEAFLAAQDATVDFSRGGNSAMASTMKKLIPFFNASMQGVYRTGRQLTEGESGRAGVRAAKNIINTGLMSALASALILKFMGDDEKDEFANMLSDSLKSNHIMLPNPMYTKDNGEPPFLRIPLAQDPLTYAVHAAVTDAIWNGSEDETAIGLAAIADTILDNLNPLGSGTIFQPMVDASHNRTWYGSAIIRNAMKDWTDPSGQFNEDTPKVFRWLGNLLNTSPEIVEYITGQYTGFLGSTLMPMLTYDATGEAGGFDALVNSVKKKWMADPTTSNDITSAFYDAAADMTTIQGEAKQGKPQGLLLRSLTPEQVNVAYEEADAMLKSGGVIYDTKQIISEAYKKIDSINANPSLDDSQKAQLAREERKKMLEAVEVANQQIQAYYKKYITGESVTDRMVGQLLKRFTLGDTAHVKTAEEKLPQIFQSDADSPYMQKALSIFQNEKSPGYQREAALPHPSKEFDTRDPVTKNRIKHTISDDEWEVYTGIYRDAYSAYLDSKIVDWDLGNDARKYEILKGAHAAANKKMKDAYLATHAPAETAEPEESDEEDHTSGGIRKPLGLIASNGASDLGFSGSSKKAPVRPASDDDWGQYMKDLDDYWLNYDFGRDDPTERNYTGTIDINNRKVVHNPDGSISTDYSFSIYDEDAGKEVLIPQVIDGRIVSQDEAIEHYYKTGEHFGMFDDWHDADEYAMMLHNRNYWYYR